MMIGKCVFARCKSLLEIKISSIVESIGQGAFSECEVLKKVEFECSSSSLHRLKSIGYGAFKRCLSLQRIKFPSSVNMIDQYVCSDCRVLVEAILSKTSITKVPNHGFAGCGSLQTVSLPSSLECICSYAFKDCNSLVTVMVPLDSKPIFIEISSVMNCGSLVNLVLPQGSEETTSSEAFQGCPLLENRFGKGSESIVAGLVHRFDNFPVHKMCYDHSSITAQELCECVQSTMGNVLPLVDGFGMTPFHLLFSTPEPSEDLLKVLLDHDPYHAILDRKDANGKRPLDYLMSNWTEITASLLQKSLQKWMVDPLASWGAASWMEAMQSKVQAVLAANNKVQRAYLYHGAYTVFEQYKAMGSISILEMALWKLQLRGGWNNDGTKRQALDRRACRCVCGSDAAIPRIVAFLGVTVTTSKGS
ncbi:unnamed protein product [Cylindrotheca closterium]|uniref:Uncharacterized protein n=1 Tax=Cylindrotheca closterium TaxID=2856 RepID=A0AAD2FPK7_9STRA|nr:unnamed protein product [Cylindrotheca closterium]